MKKEVFTMQAFIIIIVIALIAAIVYLVWRAKTSWSVIYEDNGVTEEASEQYSYLLNEGIRCRLKHIPVGTAPAAPGMNVAGSNQKVRVEVHKDHLEKARLLLKDFNPNREFKI